MAPAKLSILRRLRSQNTGGTRLIVRRNSQRHFCSHSYVQLGEYIEWQIPSPIGICSPRGWAHPLRAALNHGSAGAIRALRILRAVERTRID